MLFRKRGWSHAMHPRRGANASSTIMKPGTGKLKLRNLRSPPRGPGMVTDKIPLLTLANPFFVVNLYTEYVLKEVKVGGSAGGTGMTTASFPKCQKSRPPIFLVLASENELRLPGERT